MVNRIPAVPTRGDNMCTSATMSIRGAVQSLKDFMLDNIPDGTPVDITAAKVEELSRLTDNVITLAFDTSVVDLDKQRQVHEAVGWLSVQIEDQFLESTFEDRLLEVWATGLLAA